MTFHCPCSPAPASSRKPPAPQPADTGARPSWSAQGTRRTPTRTPRGSPWRGAAVRQRGVRHAPLRTLWSAEPSSWPQGGSNTKLWHLAPDVSAALARGMGPRRPAAPTMLRAPRRRRSRRRGHREIVGHPAATWSADGAPQAVPPREALAPQPGPSRPSPEPRPRRSAVRDGTPAEVASQEQPPWGRAPGQAQGGHARQRQGRPEAHARRRSVRSRASSSPPPLVPRSWASLRQPWRRRRRPPSASTLQGALRKRSPRRR